MGYRVQGSGFRVYSLQFRVYDLEIWVCDIEIKYRAYDLGSRVWFSQFRVEGVGCKSSGFKVCD